jgi:hypothetical protein
MNCRRFALTVTASLQEGCVAKIAPVELRRLAVVGARARLVELKAEMASLVRAFPEIGRAGAVTVGGGAVAVRRAKPGRKTPMTAAERREVSERMKKYWAARRAAKNKK